MTTKEILQKALEFFGPNGENWVNKCPKTEKKACALLGLYRVADNEYNRRFAERVLRVAIGGGSIVIWNNKQTWPDVKAAYERAIEIA